MTVPRRKMPPFWVGELSLLQPAGDRVNDLFYLISWMFRHLVLIEEIKLEAAVQYLVLNRGLMFTGILVQQFWRVLHSPTVNTYLCPGEAILKGTLSKPLITLPLLKNIPFGWQGDIKTSDWSWWNAQIKKDGFIFPVIYSCYVRPRAAVSPAVCRMPLMKQQ